VVVTEAESIAAEAGIAVDDEIIAVAGIRLGAGGLDERMKQHPPGERVEILIARRGELRTIAITLAAAPEESWKLEVKKDATSEQKARLAAWLGDAGKDLLPAPATAPAGVPEEEGGE
jgi:predicted metalloprotease with PDZ domain